MCSAFFLPCCLLSCSPASRHSGSGRVHTLNPSEGTVQRPHMWPGRVRVDHSNTKATHDEDVSSDETRWHYCCWFMVIKYAFFYEPVFTPRCMAVFLKCCSVCASCIRMTVCPSKGCYLSGLLSIQISVPWTRSAENVVCWLCASFHNRFGSFIIIVSWKLPDMGNQFQFWLFTTRW